MNAQKQKVVINLGVACAATILSAGDGEHFGNE